MAVPAACRICNSDHSYAINLRSIKYEEGDPKKRLQDDFNSLFKHYVIYQIHFYMGKVKFKEKDKVLEKLKQFTHKHPEFVGQMPVPVKLIQGVYYFESQNRVVQVRGIGTSRPRGE